MWIQSSSGGSDLVGMIARLEADRRRHAESIAEIDRVLDQVARAVGIAKGKTAEEAPAPIRLELTLGTIVGKRGKFPMSGEASVLDFIRRQVRPSTAEINAHWRGEGRRGTANVILLRLLKAGQIVRQRDPDVRGSRYALAPSASANSPANVDQPAPSLVTEPTQAMPDDFPSI